MLCAFQAIRTHALAIVICFSHPSFLATGGNALQGLGYDEDSSCWAGTQSIVTKLEMLPCIFWIWRLLGLLDNIFTLQGFCMNCMQNMGKVRRSGDPYWTHPLSVADILALLLRPSALDNLSPFPCQAPLLMSFMSMFSPSHHVLSLLASSA